jgi:hypothetical protein
MRWRLLLFPFCLLLSLLTGQLSNASSALRVNEAATRFSLQERSARVSLALENPDVEFAARIRLELLDPQDHITWSVERDESIGRGASALHFVLPVELSKLSWKERRELLWYRLRYRIEPTLRDESESALEGLVSLSEITPDIFALRVTDYQYARQGLRYHARVRAYHPLKLHPVAGVHVEGEFHLGDDDDDDETDKAGRVIRAMGITDEMGYASLDFDLPRVIASAEGELKVRGRRGDYVQEVEGDIMIDTMPRSLITTDKPLYQPGQLLHARVLIFDSTMHALSSYESGLRITDSEQTTLFRATLKTSRYGVASIDWPIPENTRLGEYDIQLGGEDHPLSSFRFKISRYELPNFTVNVKPDRAFYLPGQDALVEVRADYLFGQKVGRGNVRIVRETEREWDYHEQQWKTEEGEEYEGETDAEGRFTARIPLTEEQEELKDSGYRRFQDLSFAAYFTDRSTNRTEERRFDLRITKEPIHIYVIQQDSYQNALYPLSFYLSTFYADGSPASCAVTISDNLPESEAHASQRAATSSSGQRRLRIVSTNAYGLAKVDDLRIFGRTEADEEVSLSFAARDARGQLGREDETIWTREGTVLRVLTDKTLYRAGETIRASITSSEKDRTIFVDVMQDWRRVLSQTVRLRDGRAVIDLPYSEEFRDALTIVAYGEHNDSSRSHGARTILYPCERRLRLDVQPAQTTYRPGEEAQVNVRVRAPIGSAAQSAALGVVVFDKAVEERMRTDEAFGGSGYASYNMTVAGLLGEDDGLAGISRGDLNRLNLSQPVPANLQLLAEVMLNRSNNYYPRTFSVEDFETDTASVFSSRLNAQMIPLNNALSLRYAQATEYPTDVSSLRGALARSGIDFDEQRDPWGTPYRAVFLLDKGEDALELTSAGVDKRFETTDDIKALRMSWPYFRRLGEAIDHAVRDHHLRTGGFIRDAATLRSELRRAGIEPDALRDRWGQAYRLEFDIDKTDFVLKVQSGGPNGRFASPKDRASDDFTIWANRMNYFAQTFARVDRALLVFLEAQKRFPQNDAELSGALKKSQLDSDGLRDPWGNSYYAVFKTQPRYADRASIQSEAKWGEKPVERTRITTVKETLYQIVLSSSGPDGRRGTTDDFMVGDFSRVLSEHAPTDARPVVQRIKTSYVVGANGAIRGIVTDPNGAVIAGVAVKATHVLSLQVFEATTNSDGQYLLRNLPPGMYTVTFDAANFKSLVITQVSVNSSSVTDLPAQMNVGTISETVSVVGSRPELVQTTSSQLSLKAAELPKTREANTSGQASTPRLREYFPETLLWQPSIETDAEGRAEVRFKLADNITTWKMTVIGSTLDGELGTAEQEIRAFQPFFVEHDPPRILTEGDEIELPVVLRNYLDKEQSVELEIKPESWFTLLGPSHKRSTVASNDATRETFSFRATTSTKEGKQRITATSAETGDQIEKPVSVHPNGEERALTASQILTDRAALDLSIPTETIKNTARAEVKIYPNLLTHVMESVEAIMERPYGCAEQTISSTYPSLLVLRHDKRVGRQSTIAPRALRYLKSGYERLLNYRSAEGGFTYWGRGEPDVALTAYALRFLNDAEGFITVDQDVIEGARDWLTRQQHSDGSWPAHNYYHDQEDARRTSMLTAYVARVLASTRGSAEQKSVASTQSSPSAQSNPIVPASTDSLPRALAYLAPRVKEFDEPYLIASYALAAFDAGDLQRAVEAVARLRSLAREEAGTAYWPLETNTPFYGWGLAGRIETTALALQALTRSAGVSRSAERVNQPAAKRRAPGAAGAAADIQSTKTDDAQLASRGLLFLLRQKDRYGVWYSTQATVNVLDAITALLANPATLASGTSAPRTATGNHQAEIIVNGQRAALIALPAEDQLNNPISIDVSGFLTTGRNLIEIRREAGQPQASVQAVATYYVPWTTAALAQGNAATTAQHGADALRLSVTFDKTEAQTSEEVTCRVVAERVGSYGYGMMLAEVGLPPGADVDRASLERAVKDSGWSIGRYDVLPDRVIFYLWPRAAATRFEFKFRPRFGLAARTAPSLIYDYYNPEARTVVAPTAFIVR